MTAAQDLFVGVVAICVGSVLLWGAVFNAAQLMQLAKARLLGERLGQRAARIVIACCGLTVIVIGAIIASGWRVAW